ncbi:MAG: hypothetical protein KGI04_04545 [Candidatus Micrarchaeota archaeon]|nr:hypothetical protein [Candidatus Micrarchaeota archaeon]
MDLKKMQNSLDLLKPRAFDRLLREHLASPEEKAVFINEIGINESGRLVVPTAFENRKSVVAAALVTSAYAEAKANRQTASEAKTVFITADREILKLLGRLARGQ